METGVCSFHFCVTILDGLGLSYNFFSTLPSRMIASSKSSLVTPVNCFCITWLEMCNTSTVSIQNFCFIFKRSSCASSLLCFVFHCLAMVVLCSFFTHTFRLSLQQFMFSDSSSITRQWEWWTRWLSITVSKDWTGSRSFWLVQVWLIT